MSQHSGEKNKKLLQYILNVEDYPVKLRKERRIVPGSDRQLGAGTIRDLEEGGRLKSTLGNLMCTYCKSDSIITINAVVFISL